MRKIRVFLLIAAILFCMVPGISVQAEELKPNERTTENVDNVISVSKDAISLEEFSSAQIDFTVSLEAAHKVILTSSDNSIATVSETGAVNALKAGEVSITILVVVDNSTDSYSKTVKVSVYSLSGTITFSTSDVTISRGEFFTVEYTLSTAALSNRDIVWTSSNPSVASVVNGRVTAVSVGETQITAQVGSISASMKVKVVVPLSKIEFNPLRVDIELGQSMQIPPLVYVPYDTTNSRIATYSVENAAIVSITGNTIRGMEIGRTVIYARIGEIEAALEVVVIPQTATQESQKLPLTVKKSDETSIILDVADISKYQGNKYQLLMPLETVRNYISEREAAHVVIVFDELLSQSTFKYFSGLILDSTIMTLANDHPFDVTFVDKSNKPILQYRFSQGFDSELDLHFQVTKSNSTSAYYSQLGSPGYDVKFFTKAGFPTGTRIGIGSELLGDSKDKLHFLYLVEDEKLVDTNQEIRADETGLVQFRITDNLYVVTFSKIGAISNSSIIIFLVVVIVLIVAGVVMYYVNRLKHTDNSVV